MADETQNPNPPAAGTVNPAAKPLPHSDSSLSGPFPSADAAVEGKIAKEDAESPGAQFNMPEKVQDLPAAQRLRAFEDEHFGKDAVRINGRVERGSGSQYQRIALEKPELHRQYQALDHLLVTEKKVEDARALLAQVESDHKAALAAAEPRPSPDEPKQEPAKVS
jgi:hypothetical protein